MMQRVDRLACAVLLLVLAAVYLALAPRHGLWGDETFSATAAQLSTSDLLTLIRNRELNGAPQLLLLHALHLGAAAEWAIRVPSIVETLLAVAAFVVLAHRLLSRVWAWFAVALFALSGVVAQQAISDRQYALVTLLVVVSLLLAVTLDESPSTAAAVAFALVVAVGAYAHFFVAFLAAVEVVWLCTGPARRRVLTVSVPLTAVLTIPLLAFLASAGNDDQVSWIGPLSRGGLEFVPFQALLATQLPVREAGVLFVSPVLAVAVVLALRRRAPDRLLLLLAGCAAGPVVLAALVSLRRPLFLPRYLAFVVVPTILLISVCLSRIERRSLAGPLAAAPLLVTVASLPAFADTPVEHWKPALEAVVAQARPGATVDSVLPAQWSSVNYYRSRIGRNELRWATDGVHFARDAKPLASLVRSTCPRNVGRDVWIVGLDDARADVGVQAYASCEGLHVAGRQVLDGMLIVHLADAGV